MSKEAVNEVSDVVDKHIFDINREQVSLTRVDTGYLKNSNDFDVQDKKYKEIFNNANYAAFIEFGTGKGVNVPTELQQYARQFKGQRPGDNIPASPFFFAPFFKRRQAILRDIVKVLQKFGK